MAIRQSPYAKMYLVSPAIYGKLLSCLDDRDKAMTESLNPDKPDEPEEKRPSEQLLEKMHQEEINPQVVVQEQTPFITPQALQEGLAEVLPQYPPPPTTTQAIIPPTETNLPTQALIPDYHVPSQPSPFKINPKSLTIAKRKKGKKLPLLPITAYEENLPLSELQRRRKYPDWFSPATVSEGSQPLILMPQVMRDPSGTMHKKPTIFMPEIARDPTVGPHKKPTIFMPEIMAGPSVPSAIPNCVKTKRGTICSVATTGRVSAAKEKYVCEYCGTTVGRLYDFKKHLLKKHDVEVEPSYRRWGIETDELMDEPQGVKRTQSKAGITNRNPSKVTRVEKEPSQSGSGCYQSWCME